MKIAKFGDFRQEVELTGIRGESGLNPSTGLEKLSRHRRGGYRGIITAIFEHGARDIIFARGTHGVHAGTSRQSRGGIASTTTFDTRKRIASPRVYDEARVCATLRRKVVTSRRTSEVA